MRRLRGNQWFVIALPLLFACIPAVAGPLDPQVVSSVGGGGIVDISVQGGVAVCASIGGLSVYDLSDPTNLHLLESIDNPWFPTGITVHGHYAYVRTVSTSTNEGPVFVYDVSDPGSPVLVASWDALPHVGGIAFSDSYAYLLVSATSGVDLIVVDVKDPAHPAQIGTFSDYYCSWGEDAIDVVGGYARVVEPWDLTVLDVSDPASIARVARVEFSDYVSYSAFSGDYVYVVMWDSGLHVFDVSTPGNPIEVAVFDTSYVAGAVGTSGNVGCIADYQSLEDGVRTTLRMLDLTDPSSPVEVGSCEIAGYVDRLAIDGSILYAVVDDERIVAFGISGGSPVELGSSTGIGWAERLALDGATAYIEDLFHLHAVDVSDVHGPVLSGSCNAPPREVSRLAAADHHLYATLETGGLMIFDFGDPVQPREVFAGYGLDSGWGPLGMALSYPWLYLSDGVADEFRVVDVSQPSSPVDAAEVLGLACYLTVCGSFVYAESGDFLEVVDVSDPYAPAVVGQVLLTRFWDEEDLAAANGYVYRALGVLGLEICDVSDPSAPTLVEYFAPPEFSVGNVAVSGCYAYLADSYYLRVLDVSDPRSPVEVGSYHAWGSVSGVAASGRYVYVADSGRGLVVLENPVPYVDIPSSFWAYDEIAACRAAGIVQGYWDATYHPNETVTRGQMAVYVSRAVAGGEEMVPTGPATATFPDVPTGHWAFKYVEYACSWSIVLGYWDGYHPDEMVTRAQMAVFTARSICDPLGEEGMADYVPPALPTFPDVDTSHWAYKYVEYAHERGVVQGYWDGYHPDETVNRAQMAVYVARAFALPM
jgi:hypothetical protein